MINKPSLVLVPGLLCDAALWRGQVEDLADIAQPWVADVTRDNSMTAMARRVLEGAKDGTRAAILIHLAKNIEEGKGLYTGMIFGEAAKPVPVEDASQEPDVFTAEALAKIPLGKPDPSTLARPKKTSLVKELQDAIARKEGEYWIDEAGRHWKIVEGKKRQQKKPKVDPIG